LPDASILNWAELYFKDIVFDVFKNGLLKVNVFCFVPNAVFIVFNEVSTFDLIAYTVKSGLFIIVLFQSLWKFVGLFIIVLFQSLWKSVGLFTIVLLQSLWKFVDLFNVILF
jgi:hypothetical protein